MASQHKLARFLRSRAVTATAVSMLFTFVVLYCYVAQPRLLRMLDYKIYDSLLFLSEKKQPSEIPVIIDLDEASLEAYGQWPWPRFVMAGLLQKLEAAGIAATGLDILLSEEDRSSPEKIQQNIRAMLGLELTMQGLPDEWYNYDNVLAGTLGKKNVLGMYCNFGKAEWKEQTEESGSAVSTGIAPQPRPLTIVQKRTPDAVNYDTYLHKTTNATLPLPAFSATAPVGMINMNADLDGVVRRIPLVGMYNGKAYASLALRTLMTSLNQNMLFVFSGPDGLESVKVGHYVIPVEPDGNFILPFKGPAYTFPYYSAKDVMEGKIGAEQLAGRIAFIGTSAPGLLDIRITPLERVYPGVEAHATLLDAIITKNFLHVPPWTPGLQIISIIMAGIIAGLSFGFAGPRVYIPVGAALLCGVVYSSFHLFGQGFVVSPLYASITVVCVGSSLLALRFWQEEKQKKVLRSAFSRYVAPEVVERISKLEGDIFAGEEHDLTIMFTDIRGFTSISEKLSPQQIVSLLNQYFTPMTSLVRGNSGTLDKFIGDALMAFWNAPVPVPGHERLAVQTALQMQEKLIELNPTLEEEFGISLRMGVGMHTGKAYVGNMGSEELLNYTLIGDNVNLASRLEGLCSQFGVLIVVSAETKEAAGDGFAFLPLDTLRVKGKKLPVSTFTVMRPEEFEANSVEHAAYVAAHEFYTEGSFTAAKESFSKLNQSFPDKKLYSLYLERCEAMIANPPEEWDGVWTLTSK